MLKRTWNTEITAWVSTLIINILTSHSFSSATYCINTKTSRSAVLSLNNKAGFRQLAGSSHFTKMRHHVEISAPITVGSAMQAKRLLLQGTTDLQTLTVVKIPHIFVIKISHAFLRHRRSTVSVDLKSFIVWKEVSEIYIVHATRINSLNRCQPCCMTSFEMGPSLQQTSFTSSKWREFSKITTLLFTSISRLVDVVFK